MPLADLAAYLDGSVTWNLTVPGESGEVGESFITAAILDIPDAGDAIEVIECGHSSPIMVRGRHVTTIDLDHPALPLGLGELAPSRYHVQEVPFGAGDLLLLYTDGVIEARDSTGAFYPLAERIEGWVGCHPDAFLHHLKRDLFDHVGGHLNDDAAVIAIERLPVRTDLAGSPTG
ncbi:MAG: PP2C family protein-serine/threonine phosphatase [Streptomyces sp.]|uniref:PP2C family protein-serine/threonine phosphatase n=1 Tax=Streptomyces sp. TaxID=1931 RepID=UPI003D6B18FA